MAIYRSIYMNFWSDTKVADEFTPEDKYFMLYCLTNNHTNLCGCYEISIRQMSRDLGYNEESVRNLLKRFNEIHKVIFYNEQNKELFIKNWSKYNWTRSEKLDKPLLKEIESIKTADFKRFLVDEYNKRDTISIPYIYPMDTSVSVSVTDTVTDNKDNIIEFYNNNINLITPFEFQKLQDYFEMDSDLIIYAMQKAVLNNKKSFAYIDSILKSWKAKGYTKLIQAQNEDDRFRKSKQPKDETDEERIARKIREMEEYQKNVN